MPRLLLCADDFGHSPAISATIVELAIAGKINAISCMAAAPGWATDSALLEQLPANVEIGLHLVLAGETPITAMPRLAPGGQLPTIDQLTIMALRRRLPLDEIAVEIAAQFRQFRAMTGRPPAFVDGHQHSHVLPGIRRLVIAATRVRAPDAWLRDCGDRPGAVIARPFRRKAMASAVNAAGFSAAAAAAGLRCNAGFAGHYDFRGDYARLFPRFLQSPGEMHLVMCHPGAAKLAGDSIAEARITEAAALRMLPIRDMAASHGLSFNI